LLALPLAGGCGNIRAGRISASGARISASGAPPPTVVFLTDFGLEDDSVAICKGVMWSVEPRLRVVDLTHLAPPFDVRAASRLLAGAAPYFPAGAVFVVVVDPGVGTERRPLALRTKAGRLYVGPDNGVFTGVVDAEGLEEARRIDGPRFMRTSVSSTFHGRDVFAPAAAHLASGARLEDLGPIVPDPVHLDAVRPKVESGELVGSVDFVEKPYGNVITDIPAEMVLEAGLVPGDRLEVRMGGKTFLLPLLRTFGEVAEGQELALPSSRGRLSFSVNMGDFARRHGIGAGQGVRVRKAPR